MDYAEIIKAGRKALDLLEGREDGPIDMELVVHLNVLVLVAEKLAAHHSIVLPHMQPKG